MKKISAFGLALVALAACDARGPQPPVPPVEQHAQVSGVTANSALGAYLAARMAQVNGDTKSAADFLGAALAHESDNTDLLQSSLLVLLTEGRLDEAKPIAQALLTYESDAAWPLVLLGVDAANRQDYSEARKLFAAVPKRSINAVLAPLLLAWSLAGNGLPDAALEALSPLAQFEGFKPVQALHAGLILDQAGRVESAIDQYKIALSGPLNIRTIEAVGSAYQRLGRQDEARDLYRRYMDEHPETMLFDAPGLLIQGDKIARTVPDARTGMAAVFFDVSQLLRQGDTLQMSMIFNRMALYLQPDFPLAQLTAGDLLTTKGDLVEADALYRSISARSPVHSFAHLKLAANLDEQGDTQGAIQELSALQADLPNTIEIPITLGDLQRRHKNFVQAAAAYTKALTLFRGAPSDAWALHFSRGVCYERAHDWPQAEADFRQALTLKPDQPDVLNYLGYTWIDRGINLHEARAMIEKAVKLRPRDGAIVDSLGWALYRLGDFYPAVENLEKAVELKPVDPTINEHLGDAYWKVGRQEEARLQWRRALGLDPEPEQIDGLTEKNRTGRLPETIPAFK